MKMGNESAHRIREKKMETYEIVEGTLEELVADFCEKTLRSARNAKEADAAVANFLTGILYQQPISKSWH
jgi:hypothetical protein